MSPPRPRTRTSPELAAVLKSMTGPICPAKEAPPPLRSRRPPEAGHAPSVTASGGRMSRAP
eukprot:6573214-Pyramimonas_sp.AAC.1